MGVLVQLLNSWDSDRIPMSRLNPEPLTLNDLTGVNQPIMKSIHASEAVRVPGLGLKGGVGN